MDKINFSDYEAPGIGADNLNQLQNNIEKSASGIVLYSNSAGTNGNIIFSESAQAGDLIEIVYAKKTSGNIYYYKSTGKIPYISGMQCVLDMSRATSDVIVISSKIVTITSTGIGGGNIYSVNIGSTGIQAFSNNDTTIYILKVVAYR